MIIIGQKVKFIKLPTQWLMGQGGGIQGRRQKLGTRFMRQQEEGGEIGKLCTEFNNNSTKLSCTCT